MTFLFSIFFGAGVAAWVYSKLGRRIGYGNTQHIWVTVGVVFLLATAVFYSVFALLLT